MNQEPLPQTDQAAESQQETTTAKCEEINRQQIRVGTLEEFVQEVFKRPLEKMDRLAGVWLTREKFRTSRGDFYRLIWVARDKAWLAAEDVTEFRRVYSDDGVVEAGKKLAGELNVRFSEIAR